MLIILNVEKTTQFIVHRVRRMNPKKICTSKSHTTVFFNVKWSQNWGFFIKFDKTNFSKVFLYGLLYIFFTYQVIRILIRLSVRSRSNINNVKLHNIRKYNIFVKNISVIWKFNKRTLRFNILENKNTIYIHIFTFPKYYQILSDHIQYSKI